MNPDPLTTRSEESEPDALPPWAAGVVRTLKAPPNSGAEWTSVACVEDLIAENASHVLGLRWLQAPGVYVVQINSMEDIESAFQLRQLVNAPTAMFVLAMQDPLELELAVLTRLSESGISVSHHRSSSARDSACREMREIFDAGVAGIDNFRRFAEDISARTQASPAEPL